MGLVIQLAILLIIKTGIASCHSALILNMFVGFINILELPILNQIFKCWILLEQDNIYFEEKLLKHVCLINFDNYAVD